MEKRKEHAKGGAGILYWRKGPTGGVEVLLGLRARTIKHAPGTWSHPGGSLKAGEGPLAGALREAREETCEGLPAVDLRSKAHFREPEALRKLSFLPIARYEYSTFGCEVLESPPAWPQPNWEHETMAWFPVDRLPSPLHGEARTSIRKLLLDQGSGPAKGIHR